MEPKKHLQKLTLKSSAVSWQVQKPILVLTQACHRGLACNCSTQHNTGRIYTQIGLNKTKNNGQPQPL